LTAMTSSSPPTTSRKTRMPCIVPTASISAPRATTSMTTSATALSSRTPTARSSPAT